jgi:hypothetical protein
VFIDGCWWHGSADCYRPRPQYRLLGYILSAHVNGYWDRINTRPG